MILTCPQCETRYQVDGGKFPPEGRSVRCAKCGHVWHQLGLGPEPDAADPIALQEAEHRAPNVTQPAVEVPEPRVAAFSPPPAMPAHAAQEQEDVVEQVVTARTPLRRRMLVGAGWLVLGLLVLVIGWAAYAYRDIIVTWVPQASSIYSAVGLNATAQGLDITDVAYQNQIGQSQDVLVVSGNIINRSEHELNVPGMRVALFDVDKHELFHWTFVPGVSTLQPGESARFQTRLSSPPAVTSNLEIRFVRPGE